MSLWPLHRIILVQSTVVLIKKTRILAPGESLPNNVNLQFHETSLLSTCNNEYMKLHYWVHGQLVGNFSQVSQSDLPAIDGIGVLSGVSGSMTTSTYEAGKIPCRPRIRPSYQFSSSRLINITLSPFRSDSSSGLCAVKLYLALAWPSLWPATSLASSSDVTTWYLVTSNERQMCTHFG